MDLFRSGNMSRTLRPRNGPRNTLDAGMHTGPAAIEARFRAHGIATTKAIEEADACHCSRRSG